MRKAAGSGMILMIFLAFLLEAPLALATGAAASGPVYSGATGQVYPAGKAQVFLGNGRWLGIDRVYPVPGAGNFRTWKGSLSFLFSDGTRMIVGADSAIGLKRLPDRVLAVIICQCKSVVNINVPPGNKAVIVTPAGARLESGPKGFAGIIYFEGWQTRITTLAGNIAVAKDKGLAGLKETCAAMTVPRCPATDPVVFTGLGSSGGSTGLLIGGGLAGGMAAGVGAELSLPSASPYVP